MSDTVEIERNPLTKKELAADKPTWCPGCGDFSVLALYFKLIQNRGLHHESSPPWPASAAAAVPVFCAGTRRTLHPRPRAALCHRYCALPAGSGCVCLRRRRRCLSIGGNHFNHCARKNVNLTYVVMDNNVYGLTKKQTSPPARSASKVRRICGAPWTSRSTRCSRPSRPGHLRGAQHAHQPEASTLHDGSCHGSQGLCLHRMPERMH